jgi:probable phosphoglycerate mutase
VTRRLLLVRHGMTAWNREGRFQGHLDPELAEDGLLEARLLAARMTARPDERPSLIVTSSLARASQTADVLADVLRVAGHDVEVRSDPRLMEIGQGEWEGRTHGELEVDDAERYADWRAQRLDRPPGAEPLEAVAARVAAAVAEALQAEPATICLVSHGGTLRIAGALLLSVDRGQAWRMDLDNCSLSSLARDESGGWQLERWNDTSHLLGRTPPHVDEAQGQPLAL